MATISPFHHTQLHTVGSRAFRWLLLFVWAAAGLLLLGAFALPAAAQDDVPLSDPGDTEEVCRPLPSGPSIPTCDGGYEGGVALVGGSVASEGSILICHDNEYRSVCDDFFTHRGSGIVCRQLGYPTGIPTYESHFVGDADDVSYWLDDVDCRSTEANLGDCPHPGWGLHNCGARERAGVICMTRVTGIYAVGGERQVSLSWDTPLSRYDHGITGHEYRYKTRGEDGYRPWQPIPDSAPPRKNPPTGKNFDSYTVTGLFEGTWHSFQVRIVGGGHASEPGTASVQTAGEANRLPEFGGPATRSVAENSAAGSAVGAPVTATDADGDTLRYSLEAVDDHASFTIDSSSGQIETRAAHDYEARSRYAVRVKADDGAAGSDTVAVTIEIADVEEQPTAVEIVTGPGADGVWNAGERVEVRVRFGVPVRVDVPSGGREPEVVLAFSGSAGGSSRAHSFGRAAYTGGSGSDTLSFAYTVSADNTGAGSVAVPRNALVKRDAHIEPASGEPERDRTETPADTETTENPGATAATHTTGRPGATGGTDTTDTTGGTADTDTTDNPDNPGNPGNPGTTGNKGNSGNTGTTNTGTGNPGGDDPARDDPARDDTTAAEPTGYLENPGHNSFQSGIGVISGWVCEADKVEIEIETERGETERHEAGYGTARADTARRKDGTPLCGDTDNSFGLLFNWNRLGDGEHTVVALVDGVELGRATVTVTTLDEEFLRAAEGECVVDDFPSPGETVTLEWQQNTQNFVMTRGTRPAGENRAGVAGMGYLENPGPNSFQSGIGLISGWVCEADEVEIAIGDMAPQEAAYGTERLDTRDACGDTDNGFGLLFNWNLLGDGEHEVVAYVDGAELGWATVTVTTLGEEFVRGAEGECVVEDFPLPGQTVTLAWQQTSQNFVVTDVE